MNIVELPVGEESIRLNWDRSKFSAIIPVSKDSSTLHYDGMQLNLSIGASAFNQFMDNLEAEDNNKEQLETFMSKYIFAGEVFCSLNNPNAAHLQHTKWETNVVKVVEKDTGLKIQCRTDVTSSFLVNEGGKQVTKSVIYQKNHMIGKCRSKAAIQNFIIDNLSRDLIKNVALKHNDRRHWTFGEYHFNYGHWFYFNKDGVMVPVYINTSAYRDHIIEGAALKVELSRFGNIEQGRVAVSSADIEAHSRLQAAKIAALGPLICQKLIEAEHLSNYKGMFPMYTEAARKEGVLHAKKALMMLGGNI